MAKKTTSTTPKRPAKKSPSKKASKTSKVDFEPTKMTIAVSALAVISLFLITMLTSGSW